MIDYKTGESVSFRTAYNPVVEPTFLDLSCEEEDIFEEVAPFAVDVKTGKFLNESSVPKIISKGKINIQDKIQSFAKEVDMYSILEKFAYSGDTSFLNARDCSYGDLSQLPNDLNGFANYTRDTYNKLAEINPEIAKMILDDKVSSEDIQNKVNEIVKAREEAFAAAQAGESEAKE